MNEPSPEIEESDWNGLCKIGGVPAFVLLLYSVVTLIHLMTFGGAAGNRRRDLRLARN